MAGIETPISELIYDAIARAAREDAEERRGYLGASSIGSDCERALWYSFRFYSPEEQHDGRLLRLFRRGHHEEPLVHADLERAGFEVRAFGDDGRQLAFVEVGGHFRGHADGLVRGGPLGEEWHLLEIKTHNTKSFNDVSEKGVKASQPKHFIQMQTYMGALGLKAGLYFAVRKEDDTVWTEVVPFNEQVYEEILAKATRIIDSRNPPLRPPGARHRSERGGAKEAWTCGFCQHKAHCIYGTAEPEVTCRSCRHVAVAEDGVWYCRAHHAILSMEDQMLACASHEIIEEG